MSFIWGSSETNSCKECSDKDKRLSDYESFFNDFNQSLSEIRSENDDLRNQICRFENELHEKEAINEDLKSRLSQTESELSQKEEELRIEISKFRKEIDEMNTELMSKHEKEVIDQRKKYEDLNTESTTRMMDKISCLETEKKSMEKFLAAYIEKNQEEATERETEKTRFEDLLEQKNNEKMFLLQHQKKLDENIRNLIHSLGESEEKYQDLLQRVTEQNVLQSDEIRELEQDISSVYDKKLEDLAEDFERAESKWNEKESQLSFEIQKLSDENDSLKMDLQDLKYEILCLKDANNLKQQESIILTEDLKKKDEEIRKRETESNKLVSEIDALKKDLESLRSSDSFCFSSPDEKKIAEIRLHNLSSEPKNSTIIDIDNESSNTFRKKKKTQKKTSVCQPQNGYNFYYPSFVETGNKGFESFPRDAKIQETNHIGYGVFPLNETHEKKTGEHNVENDNQNSLSQHQDDSSSDVVDGPDFFFSKNYYQTMKTPHSASADVEKKIQSTSSYENQIESLKKQNEELSKKLHSYECNSILQLNRNLRSGIPVRFFPCHTKTSYSSICSMD